MDKLLVQEQLNARCFAGFSTYQRTEIKKKLLSMIKELSLSWNGLINGIFLFLEQPLCVTHSNGLRTKNVVLSTQEVIPMTINITIEEMTEQEVAYIRVSTREQAENTNALEQQRARVIDAGAKQIFEDVLKGKNDKRPGFQRLLKLIKRGKIRTIYIPRIDRITRSLRILKILVEGINEYGVRLVILDQKIDLGTAQGK